jgi:hypothetical protein
MANTIAGANLDEIAQESLPALMSAFIALRAFTTDFSSELATEGQSVTTRYPTVPTAQNLATNYTPTDVAMTSIKVDLDTFYGFVWQFNDLERSKSRIALNDLFIEPAISALQVKIFGDLWNLVNDTNYAAGGTFPAAGTVEATITAANFDRDDVADLAQQLTLNKVPKSNRSLLLHPSHFGALAKDLNAADSAGQVTTLGEHRIPRLHGFDVYESDQCDANAVSVAGLATHKTGALIAARTVDTEMAAKAGVEISNVVLPEIGLPVQFRKWYNPDTGNLIYWLGVLYGVKFGLPNSGCKIVIA